ncbi:hypothetical protein D3C75_387910 [compost metagenome]
MLQLRKMICDMHCKILIILRLAQFSEKQMGLQGSLKCLKCFNCPEQQIHPLSGCTL